MNNNYADIPEIVIKTKAEIKESKYKYKIDDVVVYTGTLFEKYHNQEAIILKRQLSKGKVSYKVKFEDGKEMQIYEQLLVPSREE